MKPSTVLISLCCLLTVTTTCYLFYLPHTVPSDTNDSTSAAAHGYWGPPTSEFDWCETNYLLTNYIAEPWNTFTGISYIFMTLILLPFYYYQFTIKHGININHLLILLVTLLPLGIGTGLFHATLQYDMQMLDKFGMYYLISYAFTVLYVRCVRHSHLYALSLLSSTVICCALWFTERSSVLHKVSRSVLVFSFIVYFLYVFFGGAMVSRQCKDKVCEKLFDRCYWIWIFSIVFWWIDNVFCELHQHAMLGAVYIPYLNYHGTVWHLGSCMGIYYFFHVLLVYMMVEQYDIQVHVKTFAVVFPYVSVASSKQKPY